MSPQNKRPVQVPPVLIGLFRPVRWCRRQWPGVWFRLLVLAIGAVVLLSVLGAWSGCTSQRTWDNWLAGFRFSGSRGSQPRARAAGLRKSDFVDNEPLPDYLGDGKAELGEFSVRVFDPITQNTLRTDFRLEGTTSLGDQAAFERFMRSNRRFFREQVAVVLRTHNPDDLAVPDLDLLGRKIVARVNRALGERVLESAEVKGFALFESIDRSGFVPQEPAEGEGVP